MPVFVWRMSLINAAAMDMSIGAISVMGTVELPMRALLASGQLKRKPLITHRYPVSQLEDTIRMQTSAESIKVLVVTEGY